jgi:hypothetical protein
MADRLRLFVRLPHLGLTFRGEGRPWSVASDLRKSLRHCHGHRIEAFSDGGGI